MTAARAGVTSGEGSSFDRIDQRLIEQFEATRASDPDPAHDLRGLCIDSREVAETLRNLSARDFGVIREERVRGLVEVLELDDFEVGVLLLALAPVIDPAYGRVFAFLQDDVAAKRPTVGLAMRLLRGGLDRASCRAAFYPSSPLFRAGIVDLDHAAVAGGETPLVEAWLNVDDRIADHLLGVDAMDRRLLAHTRFVPDPRGAKTPPVVGGAVIGAAESGTTLVLAGPASVGKRHAARLFAECRGLGLLEVDVDVLLRCQACAPPQALRLIFREALLLGAAVYWSGADVFWSESDLAATMRGVLARQMEQWPALNVFGGPMRWEAPAVIGGSPTVRVSVPLPGAGERHLLWMQALSEQAEASEGLEATAAACALSFRLSAEQIQQAARVARSYACLEPDHRLRPQHLLAAARALSSRHVAGLAQEIEPKARWEHLVLPEDAVCQLHELCNAVRGRGRVLEDWGFGRRLNSGRGITALFAGVSGTGKTMAAEVIAGELGVALFRVDLAGVVSKWVGETEKNLDRIFGAATDSNAILFFDEADALFGKRSEVREAHDRYANLEISYLLQKMEAYEGVTILATNMRSLLDDAFLRRLTFQVTFPFPEEEDRAHIWSAVWPDELPREADVDFKRLASIKLAGGNIKNVVMAGALLAASENRAVRTADLIRGVRREYQKVGRQMLDSEIETMLTGSTGK